MSSFPLAAIKAKYPAIRIIDFTYDAIKKATLSLLTNLKVWSIPRNPHKKQEFLKSTLTHTPTLPIFPNARWPRFQRSFPKGSRREHR